MLANHLFMIPIGNRVGLVLLLCIIFKKSKKMVRIEVYIIENLLSAIYFPGRLAK